MKVNKFFTSVFLSFFLLVFISCGNMLNEKFPENAASLATDLGVTYTGSSSGGASGSNRIEKYSDGTYKFNSSGSYWISNNNGINSSTATSTWRITVTSSCCLTIYYDVSSESGCDKFTLSLNNTNIVTDVSGTVNSSVTRTLAVGQHTLIARYVKNSSNSSGSDNVKLRFDLTTGSSSSSTPSLSDFVLVSGGSFQMGNSSYSSEAPVHSVTVSSFYMCNHEVTQSEFETIMGTNPSQYKGSSYPPASGEVQNNRPVENVSWYAAIAYCNKRSIAEGLAPCYSVSGVTNWSSLSYSSIPTSSNTNWNNATCDWNATGYRLPTEAEWEYAARGGSSSYTYTYSGSSTVENVAWYTSNSASKTHEVKKKTANSLGLYDMSGNVWEWCWDLYGTYSSGSVSNPRGPSSGSEHVLRGGSWFDGSSDCRVFSRHGRTPNHTYNSNGFRVVRLGNSSSAGSGGISSSATYDSDTRIVKIEDGNYRFNGSTSGNVTNWISNNNGVDNSSATSTWRITVTGSCSLTIYYDVSSEQNYDKLNLTIDGTSVLSDISGTVNSSVTRTLTAGQHTVIATYSKDHSANSGSDRASIRFSLGAGTSTTSYTIYYSSARGSTPSSITKTYGQTLTSLDLPTLTSSGYTFVGWYTNSSYTESSRVNTGYTVTSSVTLYAKWQALSYTIYYSSSRGSTPSSITKTYGQTLTSSDLPTLTSSGYTFVGWYTSSSYTESSRVNTGYTVTSSVTLYAKWQASSSSIVKYSDGTYKFNSSGSYWISNNAGVHNSSATSTWKITVNGSCTLTIYYDVSSEQNYDKLNLSVDGTSVLSNISGTANSYVSRTLTSGQHTVIATYSKDGTQSSGDDRARVRFVISY